MCNHEQQHLIGTSEGIKCKLCGKVFKSLAELEADRPQAEQPVETEVEEQAEQPKKAATKKTTKKGAKK